MFDLPQGPAERNKEDFDQVERSLAAEGIGASGRDRSGKDDTGERPAGERVPPENVAIAALLDEIGTLLSHQGAGEFRVRAYRSASEMLGKLTTPVRDLFEQEGLDGLVCLPTIGRSIARAIQQYLRDGRIGLLDRLRGDETAERLFASLPGIGPELARRIHEALEIETLPELMGAIADGRLQRVPGFGQKRLRALRESLTLRLRHPDDTFERARSAPESDSDLVPVGELLDIDREYRQLATQGKLPKIAPLRFNPAGIAWLPILHTHRADRHYTALYSNTARAHQLNTTKDWVVIFRDDPEAHGRWTVITSQFGTLRGWRIVRGREDECEEYYIQNRTRGEHAS